METKINIAAILKGKPKGTKLYSTVQGNTALSIVFLVIAVIGLLFIIAYISNTPTALDVYKGKTELRITYEGKTPVDSVVIYKK